MNACTSVHENLYCTVFVCIRLNIDNANYTHSYRLANRVHVSPIVITRGIVDELNLNNLSCTRKTKTNVLPAHDNDNDERSLSEHGPM